MGLRLGIELCIAASCRFRDLPWIWQEGLNDLSGLAGSVQWGSILGSTRREV